MTETLKNAWPILLGLVIVGVLGIFLVMIGTSPDEEEDGGEEE